MDPLLDLAPLVLAERLEPLLGRENRDPIAHLGREPLEPALLPLGDRALGDELRDPRAALPGREGLDLPSLGRWEPLESAAGALAELLRPLLERAPLRLRQAAHVLEPTLDPLA